MKILTFIFLSLVSTFTVQAALQTETVDYKQGDAALQGYIVYDDTFKGARPGVMIVHQWMGITDHEKNSANLLAGTGYVAFVADIYGKGVRPKDTKEAGAEAGKYKKDRALLRARAQAGLDVLKKHKLTDPTKLGAIGYCFGGTTVIELARSGAKIDGVVSFHGGLDSPTPADGKNIKAKVLALHGADDPFVSAADLAAFETEMRDNKVDWQLVKYGGAVHSFTQPAAGNDNSKGAAYNEKAAQRSWEAMKQFLNELFK